MIEVILNGKRQTVSESNLSLFLTNRESENTKFAVAVNDEFIPKCDYENVVLKSGDRVELVVPMQGG